MFPVSVTQQSPAAVSMETYHVTLTLPPTQVEGVWETELGRGWEVQLPLPFLFGSSLRWNLGREGPRGLEEWGKSTQSLCPQLEVNLEEIPGEGLLVSWAFTDRPDLSLTVLPKLQAREVRGKGWRKETEQGGGGRAEGLTSLFPSPQRGEEQVELSTIEELIEDAIVSTQPAMMVNLRACSAPGGLVSRHSKQIVCVHVVSSVLCWDSCSSFYLLLLLGSQ